MSLIHTYDKPQNPQRVVVIGASGFVGSAVMKQLSACNIASVGLGRQEVDLLKPDASDKLASILNPSDCVVAVSAMAPCKNVAMLADNMILVRNIVAALKRVPVSHVINISSDAVFPDEPIPLTEAVPLAPGSIHGAMHLAREIAFQAEVPSPLAIVRPTLIYGPNDPHNGYGPNRFRRLAAKGEPIVLFGNGEERRDHILVDDLADILVRIVRHRSTGAVNVASGAVHSFRSIAEMVVAAAGSTSEIQATPRLGDMPHKGYRPFDISNLLKAFPDLVLTSLPEGIKQVQATLGGR